MRKLSLMLVALFCTLFAAQAQTVTDLKQLDNGNTYTLKSERAFLFHSSTIPGKLCASTGSNVDNVKFNKDDVNQQFRIEKNGDNY